jgi:nucleoside-diphosphate-sugar epimerase
MRLLMTGGSGVLGSASIPVLRDAGHTVEAPGRTELDLFDPGAVAAAVADMDAIVHLATRIPPPECLADREAWRDTDRLRAEATPILVDAALAASVEWFLFPRASRSSVPRAGRSTSRRRRRRRSPRYCFPR